MRLITILTTLMLATSLTLAADQHKDGHEKAGAATEKALHKAGDVSEEGIKEAGEGVDEGLDATGKGAGAVVEHTSRGVVTAGKKTGQALETAGGAVADFFSGDDDGDHSMTRIEAAQRALAAGGYYRGAIDGIAGANTRAGLREFQADRDLSVTGRIDKKTAEALGI